MEGFKAAVERIVAMMSDDFELLISRCLTDELDDAFQVLGDIYFDRVHDEVELLVDKMAK